MFVCVCICVCVCVSVCTKGQNGYKYVCFDLNQHKIQLLSFHNFASDGIFEMLFCANLKLSHSAFSYREMSSAPLSTQW